MKLAQSDKDFLDFVLKEAGKLDSATEIITHLEATDESINAYLVKAFTNKYKGEKAKAEAEVLKYRTRYEAKVKSAIGAKDIAIKQKKQDIIGIVKVASVFSLVIGLGFGIYYLISSYFTSSRAYVITDNGVFIRHSKLWTDTSMVMGVALGDYVKILEIDSSTTWCKVKKDGKTGYIASYHYLGPHSLLESLDSIYSGYKKTAEDEQMNSVIKKAVYGFVRDSSYVWCLKPTPNIINNEQRHSVVELKEKFGVVQFANGYRQGQYHLILLSNRAKTSYNKAILLKISPSYEAVIVAQVNIENASNCFFYANTGTRYSIYDFTAHRSLYELTRQGNEYAFRPS